ncbi:MAG: hypothetical protein JXA92_09620 [candidate division Zixibacteria bacterium]|nr:hypothetical protein [candidate division Zixibacteria bacterium]
MLSLLDITSPYFSDNHWHDYHGLLRQLKERYKSFCRDVPWQEFKNTMLSEAAKEACYYRAVIFEQDVAVGWVSLRAFNFGRPEQMVFSDCDALYNNIPESIRKIAARQLTEWMVFRDLRETFMVAFGRRLTAVADAWGGQRLNGLNEFVLYRNRANNEVLHEWLDTIPRRNENLHLEFFPETPENCLEELAVLLTDLLCDMPEEGDGGMNYKVSVEDMKKQIIWRRENKVPSHKVILFNERNEPVGVSMAEISLANPSSASQAMTGVRQDYRSRRLARWLKAALYFKLGEEFPTNEKIITVMRAVNEPMQKINAQMGYVLEREGTEFKVELKKLKTYLNG